MPATYKTDDINDLSVDEAKVIIACVKMIIDAIEAGHMDIPNKATFMLLAQSSHAKLTGKDDGIIQRVN